MLVLWSKWPMVLTAVALSLINQCRCEDLLELYCDDVVHCEKFQHADVNVTCVKNECRCTDAQGHVDDVPVRKCTPKMEKVSNIIGGPCPCSQPHAECVRSDDKCYCAAGHVASKDRRRCLPKNVALRDHCEMDVQCWSLDGNAECATHRQVCQCKAGFIPHAETQRCVALVGEKAVCSNNGDCQRFEKQAECAVSEKRCVCGADFVSAANSSICLPGVNWQAECNEDAQCQHRLGPGGKCATVHDRPQGTDSVEPDPEAGADYPHSNRRKCICDERHFAPMTLNAANKQRSTVCALRVVLGDYCRTQDDCYQLQLSESEQTMDCVYGECNCKHGYISINNTECFSSGWLLKPTFLPLGAAVALSLLSFRFFL